MSVENSPVAAEASDSERPPVELFAGLDELRSPPAAAVAQESRMRQLRAMLGLERGARPFALLDGAQSLELAVRLRRIGCRIFTLFEGPLAAEEGAAGPLLVAFPSDRSKALALCLAEIGGNKGILLSTYAELQDLVDHLREIFVVSDEEDREYFFRFYDPRVLRAFVPSCSPEERKQFFGPIRAIAAEDDERSALENFAPAPEPPDQVYLPGAPARRFGGR